jgi:hypothetical protein
VHSACAAARGRSGRRAVRVYAAARVRFGSAVGSAPMEAGESGSSGSQSPALCSRLHPGSLVDVGVDCTDYPRILIRPQASEFSSPSDDCRERDRLLEPMLVHHVSETDHRLIRRLTTTRHGPADRSIEPNQRPAHVARSVLRPASW